MARFTAAVLLGAFLACASASGHSSRLQQLRGGANKERAPLVRVDFFGEALCPECQNFVTSSMRDTLEAEGVASVLDFHMYPWGNAYFNTSSCATPEYTKPGGMYCWIDRCNVEDPPQDCFEGPVWCQHGDEECYDNRLEGCVIHFVPEAATYAVFMACYEEDNSNFSKCAEEAGFSKDTQTMVENCAAPSSKLGTSLEAANAKATVKLGRSKLGTPWVLVNGKYLEDPDSLLEKVCSTYTGTAPAGCN